ncbi:MAG: methyltransferase domain-containing protein [Candidatus Iainarchaeum archaeon]|uniref:Methyltransferase domain-containing protein n=1 Tax=Candidatus Iainarchaeum sp. TaxID=3101447 RepID=A0A7T9I243_9ARCH|nr:MAG: methyltransferase domain-containing protein [Candidatus Diapherotrites archaeon]
MATQERLIAEDSRHDNHLIAMRHADEWHHQRAHHDGDSTYIANDRMRVAKHYAPIHTLLELVGGRGLKGKSILHVAGSTGVYARYLRDQLQMRPVVLDIDRLSLHDAHHERQIKTVVRANAIIEKKHTGRYIIPRGKRIAVPEYETTRLPFADKSFKFVISDHFLFANYHRGVGGFESHGGSIERSEETLPELNRVLEKGGYAIIGSIHGQSLSDIRRYQVGHTIHGFVVERAYDGYLSPVAKGNPPIFIILRKVREAE